MTGLWVKPPINQSESGLSIRVDIIICAMVQTLVDGIKFSGMGPVLLTTGLGNLEDSTYVVNIVGGSVMGGSGNSSSLKHQTSKTCLTESTIQMADR